MKEEKHAKSTNELVSQIEAMGPGEKQAFCKTLSTDDKKRYIEWLKKRDMEEITVTFISREGPGLTLEMVCRPYEGTLQKFIFKDGMSYKIPIYLAKRLNDEFQGCGTWYPTHKFTMSADGVPLVSVGTKNKRFGVLSADIGYLTHV